MGGLEKRVKMKKEMINYLGILLVLLVSFSIVSAVSSVDRSFDVNPVNIGEELIVTLTAVVETDDVNYVVEENIPEGVEVTGYDGFANFNGERLRWVIEGSSTTTLTYSIKSSEEGTYEFDGYYAYNDEGDVHYIGGVSELVVGTGVCNVVADCGTDGYVGSPSCGVSGTEVFQDYRTYSCDSNICNFIDDTQSIDTCGSGEMCDTGVCVTIVSDSGSSISSSSGSSSSGSSGGGSSSSSSSSSSGSGDEEILTCEENWECGEWGECNEAIDYKTRTCTDTADCGTSVNKPRVQKRCSIAGAISDNKGVILTALGVLIIAGGIIAFLLFLSRKRDFG